MSVVSHPLSVDDRVKVAKPSCACQGAKWTDVEGTILKVINNKTGIWYFLDSGITVKAEWVKGII